MPTRKPIIPDPGKRTLLKALHFEMKEKKIIRHEITKDLISYPISTTIDNNYVDSTSSGIHSNSSSEASEEEERKIIELKQKRRNMTRVAVESEDAHLSDSSTGTGSNESEDDDVISEVKSESKSISDDQLDEDETYGRKMLDYTYDAKPTAKNNTSRFVLDTNGHLSRNPAYHQPTNKKQNSNVQSQKNKTREEFLSQREKMQLREGYEKYVLNAPKKPVVNGTSFIQAKPINGTSFAAQMSVLNQKMQESADKKETEHEVSDIEFPLEDIASGQGPEIGLRKAKRLVKVAKLKSKSGKQSIAEAKMGVSEAKLSEFDAKLYARQSKIDERHAKLCCRRAILKRAEEKLQDLESRLDEEEVLQRDRERRVKNRERRVKQEEAGIQIKEASLKKREVKITDNIKDIERRRLLVEEKEKMSSTMEDIMQKRENLHREKEDQHQKQRSTGLWSRSIFRSKNNIQDESNTVDVDSSYKTLPLREKSSTELRNSSHKNRDHNRSERNRQNRMSTGSYQMSSDSRGSTGSHMSPTGTAPIPIPRKSLEKKDPRLRSNSLNADSILAEETERKNAKKQLYSGTGSLPRQKKGQKAVMGLWL